jgi:large subunit ribosomal protein L1
MKNGKRYRAGFEKRDPDQSYALREAVDLLIEVASAKFDETTEVAMNLGVDPRHADQNVRGALVLPHGTGKSLRVIVFAKGDKEREARDAGADEVGGEDLAKRIQDGWLEFDRAIATPDMMSIVGKLGRVLGPRGLMPNPKVGTVTFDVAAAIEEQKAGKVEFRVDKAGVVHLPFGKASFGGEKLRENLMACVDAIMKAKPQSAKGTYLKNVSISTTMSPGIRLDTGDLQSARS